MRSLILIVLTIAVIGAGFGVYSWLQPARPRGSGPTARQSVQPTRPPATHPSYRGVGRGESPWVKRFEAGELVSQFRGESYDPQPGNIVNVVKPQAEFFSRDARIRVEGASGVVVVPAAVEQTPGQIQQDVPLQPPTRGTLNDVVISLYEPADASEPSLVARMNNAAFDNDHFRISTEAYTDEQGRRVEADQVAVTIRGRDYDFDGRGLTVSWNVRDQRLQRLQIDHGESLVLKNVAALGALDLAPTTRAALPGAAPVLAAASAATAGMIASSDPQPAVLLAAASESAAARRRRRAQQASPPDALPPTSRPSTTRDRSPVVYRASFESDVQIFEGPNRVAAGDELKLDILQVPSDDPTTLPAEGASATRAASRPNGSTKGSAPATTQALTGPIVIKWSGPLRVLPLDGPPDPQLVAGEPLVHLVGSPLLLEREGTKAQAGSATFNSANSTASLAASDSVPAVVLADARGATVTTPKLTYTEEKSGQRIATLIGASSARFPVEGTDASPQHVAAMWTEQCQLHLTDDGAGNLSIHKADLAGGVKVDHPQLAMQAGMLSLAFDPARAPSTAPATTGPASTAATLREIVARENVHCAITTAEGKQLIAAQMLRVETEQSPGGKTFARLVHAEGDVVTREGDRELRAGRLAAELAPSTRPAQRETTRPSANPFDGGDVELVSLVASDGVTLTSSDGTRALADMLKVETRPDGTPEYRLIGKPLASVGDANNTVSGPAIRFVPSEKIAEIEGAGSMRGAQPGKADETVDISWAGGAVVNGSDDTIRIRDQVKVRTTQADGTINAATSDRLVARLGAKPTTSPAATQPSAVSPADDMDFMAGKDIVSATLSGDVKVSSALRGADGAMLRSVDLLGETITYDRVTGRFAVPVAGQMLYQDHRQASGGDADPAKPDVAGARGRTAFAWQKSLVYDPETHQATMSGSVKVVHHPDAAEAPDAAAAPAGKKEPAAEPFELTGATLVAEFVPPAAGAAATGPANALGGAGELELRAVRLRDDVLVKSRRLNVQAAELSYDPLTQQLTATGADDAPITVFDNEKGSSQSAAQIQWNLATDEFIIRNLTGKTGP